ncbi:GntR family transcriptional regulator [Rhodococcus koreensis]|uniref:GntR family transcriptional regulator n=1 Tax=Rhodococcus sp. T2V TaxID=3034164 RepID=UPI0023E351E4|nr:GntR family transcriptional regulator [Rhodococcus sp. T2V]MDF3313111.1 GntR family transcriptional regulator [Rhodococcus sp. T2V]
MSMQGGSELSDQNGSPSLQSFPARGQQQVNVVAAPLADQVFDTLRGWIVSGQLAPGDRLLVRELAEKMGTSAMPVREAVKRLLETGLAVHEPYKGSRVRGLDVGELEQAYDVRILLEGESARLGALVATPAVADRMQDYWLALEEAARVGDVSQAVRLDEELLDTLYTASGNVVLRDIIRGLWDKTRPYKVLWVSDGAQRGDLAIWHYKPELIAAVRANDGIEAEAIVRGSYVQARNSLRAMLTGEADR